MASFFKHFTLSIHSSFCWFVKLCWFHVLSGKWFSTCASSVPWLICDAILLSNCRCVRLSTKAVGVQDYYGLLKVYYCGMMASVWFSNLYVNFCNITIGPKKLLNRQHLLLRLGHPSRQLLALCIILLWWEGHHFARSEQGVPGACRIP
jgi:hypothetical protein